MAMFGSPLAVIVKGALAGAAGTAVMSAFMERAPELMERVGIDGSEPPAPPEKGGAPGSPTEELADRVAMGELSEEERAAAGEAVHWAYGAGWGAYYAVIQSTFKLPPTLHGLFLGGLVTGVAARVIPRLGLLPPPRNRRELIVSGASHAVFGVTTATVYRILNFGRRG